MEKKHKNQPTEARRRHGSQAQKSKPAPVVQKTTPAVRDPSALIVFDSKVKVFLLLLIGLYVGMSSMKLHTSSIANWNKLFEMPKPASLKFGEPKWIRLDEWLTSTPVLIGQYNAGMPVSNPSIGSGNVPVVFGLPIKDISSILRPFAWPFFAFDIERAFAFSWNFNIFFFLISTFLLFMLLTGNKFWISVFGTFFIFFSSGVQWWSYTISTSMMYMNGATISFIYLLYHKKIVPLVFSGFIFIVSTYGYFFNLYPPFQIPLVYLYLAIFIGYSLQDKRYLRIKENIKLKAVVSGISLLILCFFVFHYFMLAKDSYEIMLNTVYPGKRMTAGGDLGNGKLFSEFFSLFMNDTRMPPQWINICEVSGFLVFFPIIFYCLISRYIKFRKPDALQLAMSAFVIVSLTYIIAGFPMFLSKVTLFSMSEARRFLPIAEAGNCMLLVIFLSRNSVKQKNGFSWVEFGILTTAVVLFFIMVGSYISKVTDNFFTSFEVTSVIILFSITYLLIRYHHMKFATPLLCVILLGINIYSHAGINPLMEGLSPVIDKPLYKTCREIVKEDPHAEWAVFGSATWAALVNSAGANVFNSVKFIPPLKRMAILDDSEKSSIIYNRFAHITLERYINWNDTVMFRQEYPDRYTIAMDPCSPRLKELGIKYFLFTYQPVEEEIRCLVPVDTLNFFLYKRKEE